MRLLGVSGSLRRDSHNTRLLRAAAHALPPGVELVVYEDLEAIPPFNEDREDAPGEAVDRWRAAIAGADGILFATPEYNGSIPGVLKNAVDWASRPSATTVLLNKPVAVIGASTGMFGALWAQAELRKVLGTAKARVVDRELPVIHAHEQFADDDQLLDDDLRTQLAEHLTALAEAVEARAEAGAA